jgi:hypothetical protein
MIGDHHGRTVRRATLLVTAADEILGTHRLGDGHAQFPLSHRGQKVAFLDRCSQLRVISQTGFEVGPNYQHHNGGGILLVAMFGGRRRVQRCDETALFVSILTSGEQLLELVHY